MKKRFLFILAFLPAVSVVFAQNTVSEMDTELRRLAGDIGRKLAAERAANAAVVQFTYQGYIPSLGTYWINQLTGELSNIPGRSFAVFSAGQGAAEWVISGEIVLIGNLVRVYTRVSRSADRSIAASFHSDFERNAGLLNMLSEGAGRDGSSRTAMDAWEIDSWENPVSAAIASDESGQTLSRTLHEDDEDFFLVLPEQDGRFAMETTGGTDTYMYVYNADTRELLEENDDSGRDSNARIRTALQAGKRYIVKVRGYGGGDTGDYGFRAYLYNSSVPSSSWENPVSYEVGFDENVPAQNRSLLEEEDEDFFLLVPGGSGRLVAETTGGTDTCMYFYDADSRELLEEDDDSGSELNARIGKTVEAGKRYIVKVRSYGDETGDYGFRAYISARSRGL